MTYNSNKFLLPHRFCGSGIWKQISCVCGPGSWDFSQVISWSCSHLRTWLGLKNLLPNGSLTWMLSWCWLLVLTLFLAICTSPQGNLSSSLPDIGCPQSKCSKKEPGESFHVLYGLASKVTHHHFCNSLWIIQLAWGDYTRSRITEMGSSSSFWPLWFTSNPPPLPQKYIYLFSRCHTSLILYSFYWKSGTLPSKLV